MNAAKPRPRSEFLMRLIQPVADGGVRWLVRAGASPHKVVLVHTAVGLAAALLLATPVWGGWVAAALLLQVKTLLDNMDGGLARITGQVTVMGRYLDTLMDLVVNAALFAALAQHGPPALAVVGWLSLTLILSLDHVLEKRYRKLRSPEAEPVHEGAAGLVVAVLRGTYALLLGTQDRALSALDRAAFRRITGVQEDEAPLDTRLAWSDLFSTASVVNLGLSTQLLVLGVCAAVGHPFAYVWLVFAQLLYLVVVQSIRVVRFRDYLRMASSSA